MTKNLDRREFLMAATAAGVALTHGSGRAASAADMPALLGGAPVRKGGGGRSWPIVSESDEEAVAEVARTGRWYRNRSVEQFEEEYARLNGAKFCVAVSSGTSALFASLGGLGIGPGDEVIVAPYTFVATVNVALLHYAMPVFADSDRETFLIDPAKIEAVITERTAAIIPVHIGGAPCDMDAILAVAKKRNIPVIEDACQAHLAQYHDRKVGNWGATGCFSFQVSKNLSSGEGGAILTNDEAIAAKCYAFHNNCRKPKVASYDFTYDGGRATNLRMTEFQGALLLSQMKGLAERAETRSANADYLTQMLGEIPGIAPARPCPGATRNAYHLYMFRYDPTEFANMPRSKFIQALGAEGISASGGYGPLNKAAFIQNALNTRPYVRVYGEKAIREWEERNRCPENDKLCEEAVWFTQSMFLGPRSDMDEIAAAVRKLHSHAAQLAKV
ncbi:MAG: DegT/DnrJ/EryC1/StrS family aminotransferase [Rhodopirellula sp.]|nr:DegT/DnrJ/EryC1/StrS family aminotransferase [Rhodopirellula sp.]